MIIIMLISIIIIIIIINTAQPDVPPAATLATTRRFPSVKPPGETTKGAPCIILIGVPKCTFCQTIVLLQ